MSSPPDPEVSNDQQATTTKVKFRDNSSPQIIDTCMEEGICSYKDCLTAGIKNACADEEVIVFGDDDMVISSDDLGPSITLSENIESKLQVPWRFTVIVKFLGRDIGYNLLCNKIQSLWKPSCIPKVIDMKNGFYLVKFDNINDMQAAVLGGPWIILGHYLTVQGWFPEFRAGSAKAAHVTAWICLPDMPPHYYHERILRTIGDLVGRTVRIDANTTEIQRGKFTRIAVELDLEKPSCQNSGLMVRGKGLSMRIYLRFILIAGA